MVDKGVKKKINYKHLLVQHHRENPTHITDMKARRAKQKLNQKVKSKQPSE
jgi:hypothetical protein